MKFVFIVVLSVKPARACISNATLKQLNNYFILKKVGFVKFAHEQYKIQQNKRFCLYFLLKLRRTQTNIPNKVAILVCEKLGAPNLYAQTLIGV